MSRPYKLDNKIRDFLFAFVLLAICHEFSYSVTYIGGTVMASIWFSYFFFLIWWKNHLRGINDSSNLNITTRYSSVSIKNTRLSFHNRKDNRFLITHDDNNYHRYYFDVGYRFHCMSPCYDQLPDYIVLVIASKLW